MGGVFIAVPCGSHARYSSFWGSLQELERPLASQVGIQIGPFIVNNQNALGKMFMRTECEWFFLANDDQVYQPGLITQLRSHGKDAVVGLCLNRRPPHTPLIYKFDANKRFKAYTPTKGEGGLIPIDGSGGGGLLLHRSVFERLGHPWWNVTTQPDGSHGGEDLAFCRRLEAAGIQLWCDLETKIGHITEFTIVPERDPNGVWRMAMVRHFGQLQTVE